MKKVLCQLWQPTSISLMTYSLHLNAEDHRKFCDHIESEGIENIIDQQNPIGEPYWIDVDDKIYNKIEEHKKLDDFMTSEYGVEFTTEPPAKATA